MAYIWTMAIKFSFKYYIDHKDHKSEEEYKVFAVESAIWPMV